MKYPPFFYNIFILSGIIVFSLVAWQHSSFSVTPKTRASNLSPKKLSILTHLHPGQGKKTRPKNDATLELSPPRIIPVVPSPLNEVSAEELKEFSAETVVESSEIEGPQSGEKIRMRILKTNFKYPFIRTEELIDVDKNSVIMREEMVASHLLVTLPESEDPNAFLKKLGPQAISMVRVTEDAPLYRVNLASPSLATLPNGLEKIAAITKGIGEPDFLVHPTSIPSDAASVPEQYTPSTQHTDYTNFQVSPQVQEEATMYINASSVIVAVIDTGIRYTHQDLAPNMWHNPAPSDGDLYGWNAYDNNGDPMDLVSASLFSGHGTHCAGIIGAMKNDQMGTSGVDLKVKLMACKYFDSRTATGTTSDVITCIYYAVHHGAQILNCSFGCYDWSFAEYDAFYWALFNGVIAVAAAGNDSKNTDEYPFYPACYQLDNILSVTALSNTDTLSSYANFGPTTILLAAPGDSIYSTSNASDTSYSYMSGTSFAVPFVTGTMALLKAQFPLDSHQELITRLINSVDKISALQGKTITGGKLNIINALNERKPNQHSLYSPSESWNTWNKSWHEGWYEW